MLDANVLLAAVLSDGLCRQVLDRCRHEQRLVSSAYLLDEVGRILTSKLSYTEAQARTSLDLIRLSAEMVQPAPVPGDACRDPNDLPVLGTAVAGEAERLVTGDKDLLVLGSFAGCVIQTPREFWQSLP